MGKCKSEGENTKMENEQRIFFFFFFFFSLLETTEICLGSTKMKIYTGKKSISRREKIGKSDFATPEKYASYTPLIYSNVQRCPRLPILQNITNNARASLLMTLEL